MGNSELNLVLTKSSAAPRLITTAYNISMAIPTSKFWEMNIYDRLIWGSTLKKFLIYGKSTGVNIIDSDYNRCFRINKRKA